MAITFYPRSTDTDATCDLGADTDGDLSETQGSSSQIDSASISDGAYRDVFSFDIDTSSGYTRSAGTFGTSLDVVASTDVQYRIVIRSVDDSGCGETDQDVGPDWTGNSIQTDTTGSITWPAADERLRLVVQGLRTTAHGNKTLSINVNDADTFCTANAWVVPATPEPVIPFVRGQYLGDKKPPIESAPSFFPFLAQNTAINKNYYLASTNLDTVCDVGANDRDCTRERVLPPADKTLGTSIDSWSERGVFDIDVTGDNPGSGTHDISIYNIVVNHPGEVEFRFRLQAIDDTGCVVERNSPYSAVFGTGGTKEFSLTLPWTVNANRLRLSVEAQRVGGAGGKTFTLDVNDSRSVIQAPWPATPIAEAQHIPMLVVRDMGDDVAPIEAAPQYMPLVPPEFAAPAGANPVIDIMKGQWLGDTLPTWDVLSHYHDFKPFSGTFPAEPVIPYRMGQWLGDTAPTWDNLSKYMDYPELAADLFPTYPVVPYMVGQWKGDTAPTWENLSKYLDFKPFAGTFPALPVIPFVIAQRLFGDQLPPVEVKPRYFPYVSPGIIAPGVHLPLFIQAAGAWLDNPPKGSHPWDPSEAPFYLPVIMYPATYEQYEASLQVNGAQYLSTSVLRWFVEIESDGVWEARVRLMKDGFMVAEFGTLSTTPVIFGGTISQDFGPVPFGGTTNTYTTEVGYTPGSTATCLQSRLELRMEHDILEEV
jgi:hypothetical protein